MYHVFKLIARVKKEAAREKRTAMEYREGILLTQHVEGAASIGCAFAPDRGGSLAAVPVSALTTNLPLKSGQESPHVVAT